MAPLRRFLLLVYAASATAFVVKPSRQRSSTRLFYRDEKSPSAVLTIPVLSPIPNQLPLLPGKELVLSTPTPGQWAALEQALAMHQDQQQQKVTTSISTIQAAPMIALMDDYTSSSSGSLRPGERYATLAAIVGVSSCHHQQEPLDLSDSSSFMESLRQLAQHSTSMEHVNVRLVGIGRAALHDFFYDISATKRQAVDDQGHLILLTPTMMHDDDEEDDDNMSLSSGYHDNVVMAQFDLLMDGLAKGIGARSGRPSSFASPVHAVSEMSRLASQVQHLHQERKRLIAGIRAAEARLRAVSEEEVDHDGIGQLFASRKAQQVLIHDILNDFGDEALEQSYFVASQQHDAADQLTSHENYGMGYSAATFSTIRDLTSVWLGKLEPYFSPDRRVSEEHFFETLSWVAMLAMDKFLQPHQIGWALQCCNTSERLQQANVWMSEHVKLLKDKSIALSKQLRDCGEECTDLW